VQSEQTWREVSRIEPASYSSWRRERQLTLYGRMFDPAERTYQSAFEDRFLQRLCETQGIEVGTPIRMIRTVAIIPVQAQSDVDALRGWTPTYVPSLGAAAMCRHHT
jgi:hypothetical protein